MQHTLKSLIERSGLSRAELVRRLGYKNPNKGHRRVGGWIEGREAPRGAQIVALAGVLGVAPEAVREAILRGRDEARARARERRAADPRFYLVRRLIPGFYATETLPAGTTEAEAMALATVAARQRRLPTDGRWRFCLDGPSGCVYFDARGPRSRSDSPPSMTVGGRSFVVGVVRR